MNLFDYSLSKYKYNEILDRTPKKNVRIFYRIKISADVLFRIASNYAKYLFFEKMSKDNNVQFINYYGIGGDKNNGAKRRRERIDWTGWRVCVIRVKRINIEND